ncbi:NAD(P)H-hydrate epimerase [Halorubrum salsamenti]|uniref:NAD(P)H-hydrate epimerase n=1 Tax=Halorubrum salsamenti TaxID=2583990 RepID=UPI0011A79E64|nr:NAD(P)H-hydrate epimerase [Halorubrum salsamenti]
MDASTPVCPDGRPVTAVTTEETRAIDRVAVEAVGLDLPRMMEHAGRGLAEAVIAHRTGGPVTVLAGNGGNGNDGLACARHPANRGLAVRVVLDRDPAGIGDVTAERLRIFEAIDVPIEATDCAPDPGIDAAGSVVSLDVPSGTNGMTGGASGVAVDPRMSLAVALRTPPSGNGYRVYSGTYDRETGRE